MKGTKRGARRDTPAGRKVGRPAKVGTKVITVRIPEHVYDAYCKTSVRTDVDVRTIMRQVLTSYARKVRRP